MKKSPRLVIIPFNLPWEWSTDYTNQTAFELAKRGYTVICYMWSEYYSLFEYMRMKRMPVFINRYSKNIYLFFPIHWIPFRRYKFICKLNEKINLVFLKLFILFFSLGQKIEKKIIWMLDPQLTPFIKYFSKNWLLIYDCVDYFPGAVQSMYKKMVEKYEKLLLNKANLVVANSTVLVNYLSRYRKDVKLVPQGFRLDSFRGGSKSQRIKRGKRPLIGFVGAINNRIDYDLLYRLAKNNPNWDFALWGPLVEEQLFSSNQKKTYLKLKTLENVIFGKSSKNEIQGVIKQFDVGMIPYDPTLDFNKYCYPMKVFEYFYLGKPVVSTDIIELRKYPKFVKIKNIYLDWEKEIGRLLSQEWPKKFIVEQKKLAFINSWENKINEILDCIVE